MIDAPASTAASYASRRNGSSEREASSALNSTSWSGPTMRLAWATQFRMRSRTSSRLVRSLWVMWMSLVAMKTWSCRFRAGSSAAAATVTSAGTQRASAAMAGASSAAPTSAEMRRTASASPGEAAGNPASMTSTRSRASCLAIVTFSSTVSAAPGVCSPSRRVVSKTRMRAAIRPRPRPVPTRPSRGRRRPSRRAPASDR